MHFLCKSAAFTEKLNIELPHFKTSFDCGKSASELEKEFNNHMGVFGLNYDTKEEYKFRLGLYMEKDAEIKAINEKNGSFKVGHNKFSTWTKEEYKQLLGYKPNGENAKHQQFVSSIKAADSVDWRTQNKVLPVKDQAQCGSCWAFSATGTVESANAIKNGNLVSLSEQQVVSCVTKDFGCDGGDPGDAFDYLETSAQETEEDYPYKSNTGWTLICNYDESKGQVKVASW